MSKNTEIGTDFEETLAELEKLVLNLETGDLPLDKSLADFKRGIELARQCQSVLDSAQQAVEQLIDNTDEKSVKPFEPDA